MLTYTYECETCGTFEVRQAISDGALARCPDCGGAVRRLVTGGSGFLMKKKPGTNAAPPRMPGCGQPEGCACPCAAAAGRS